VFDVLQGAKNSHHDFQRKIVFGQSNQVPEKWRFFERKKNISSRVARFFLTQDTKTVENIPNYHNITKWL
jgi:hypothetical protein